VLACFVFDRFLNLEKRKKLFSQYGKGCLDDRFPSSKSDGFGRPIAPSQGAWRLVARRIHPVFSKSLELVFPEKAPTFLAIVTLLSQWQGFRYSRCLFCDLRRTTYRHVDAGRIVGLQAGWSRCRNSLGITRMPLKSLGATPAGAELRTPLRA